MQLLHSQISVLSTAVLFIPSALSLAVYQNKTQLSQNLTITFTPSSASTCRTSGNEKSISFTTNLVPWSFECYDLDQLFRTNLTSDTSSRPYTLINQDAYDSTVNYTRMIYLQGNATSNTSANAALTLFTYRHSNCSGGMSNVYNCQTKAEGDCKPLSYPVRSFKIAFNTFNPGAQKCFNDGAESSAGFSFSNIPTALTVSVAAMLGLFVIW